MTNVDIIILSKTDNDFLHQMNLNCINSLLESENRDNIKFNIILIESNKNASYKYPETQIVVPDEQFGYNKFLNIGLQYAKGDYHAFCNNDLIFHKNWFSAILDFSKQNPDYLSFSPVDFNFQYMKDIAEGKRKNWGYLRACNIAGWCIVIKKEIFNHIPCIFDPQFDFYYADDDYGLTLLKNNIKHSLICDSFVDHLYMQSTEKEPEINYLQTLSSKVYPKYLLKNKYKEISTNKKKISGYLIFYNKWGGVKSLYIKYKLFRNIPLLRHKCITKLIYSFRLPF